MSFDPASLFASAKTAYDIVKSISSLNTEVERNQAVSKVLEVLLSVQNDALSMKEKHSLLLSEIDNLKKKISEFEKWSETENQYRLKEIGTGVFVYAYNQTNKSTEPYHWLCAKCFADKKKSIFQRERRDTRGTHYKCHNCNSVILDTTDKEPPIHIPPTRIGEW